MKLYVANVGVNSADASSRGLKSPIFDDGTFEFIPIKESKAAAEYSTQTYESLKCFNNPQRMLSYYLPKKLHRYVVHNDPEFEAFTYGDINSARAANLRFIQPGDLLVFLARLYDHDGNFYTGTSNFYFIGYFQIERRIEFAKDEVYEDSMERDWNGLENNVHFIRFRNGYEGGYFVIMGNVLHSTRFKRALKITPEIVELLYNARFNSEKDIFNSNVNQQVVRNKSNDKPRKYTLFHSTTRTIQSYLDSKTPTDKTAIDRLKDIFRRQCR